MEAATIAIMALMVLTATIPAQAFQFNSGATGTDPIPFVEIYHPEDGSNVDTKTTLAVRAEGQDLSNPSISVEGYNVGYAHPLGGCIFEQEEGANGLTYMTCKTELNLESFENQNVKVTVSVNEETGTLTDSVGLYVSGYRA